MTGMVGSTKKIWGTIVNESRTLTLQLQTFISQGNDRAIKELAFRHIAWCFCLGQSLRGLDPLENLGKYISEDDIKKISGFNNKPLAPSAIKQSADSRSEK